MNKNPVLALLSASLLAAAAAAQAPADCNPSLWRSGDPTLGSTVTFTLSAAPICVVANLLALDAGPIQFGPLSLPIGPGFIGLPIALIPQDGSAAQASLAIPNTVSLAGTDLFQLGVGLSLNFPTAPVVGPAGRFRLAGPAPAVGELVLLGEHALDNSTSTVITAAQLLGTTPEILTNDSNTSLLGNPWLPWSEFYAGSIVTLPMGGPGNEGIFTLTGALPFPLADLVAGTVPQLALGQVPGVMPLRNQDLAGMVGRTFVAIVHDSAIGVNYGPLEANLQGERYGRFAFTVLEVVLPGTISESGSSSSFYDLRIRVEGPMAAGAPYVATPRDVPSDSIQIDNAIWQNGLLTISAQSGVGALATMTVSVDGFTFESPMAYNGLTAQYEASFRTPINLVGRRVTISTREGGSASGTVQ
ncbi:MAG: hypothetical protein MUC36_10265 [Planctomycetes bacterium]|jgi:hypothetical protein|nr:hypothetical protein [Planctomycetota bacterium]